MKINTEALKNKRKESGKSQEEWASHISIGYRTYQEIERTGQVKGADDYVKICSILKQKIVPNNILNDTEAKYPITTDEYIWALKELIKAKDEKIQKLEEENRELKKGAIEGQMVPGRR
jgi:transcriptional regulator with XRE-family HTH domain